MVSVSVIGVISSGFCGLVPMFSSMLSVSPSWSVSFWIVAVVVVFAVRLLLSVTVSVILYIPVWLYWCVIVSPYCMVPSPSSHVYLIMCPSSSVLSDAFSVMFWFISVLYGPLVFATGGIRSPVFSTIIASVESVPIALLSSLTFRVIVCVPAVVYMCVIVGSVSHSVSVSYTHLRAHET